MAVERTLSIIKPDGVELNVIGDILNRFERAGLKIVAMKMIQMTLEQAQTFYYEQREKSFFEEYTTFMCRGPVVVSVLEGENAIEKNRELMGATNPDNAEEGTIRKMYSSFVGENTVHGSDSLESAKLEIPFFFSDTELVNK